MRRRDLAGGFAALGLPALAADDPHTHLAEAWRNVRDELEALDEPDDEVFAAFGDRLDELSKSILETPPGTREGLIAQVKHIGDRCADAEIFDRDPFISIVEGIRRGLA